MIELENAMSKGIAKDESIDDKIMDGYVIITNEIDDSDEDDITKTYLKNHFLNSLLSSILKDRNSSQANFEMRREILLRIMNIGISELKKHDDKMLTLFKQLFEICMPFYENEAKNFKKNSYNLPKIS